jgi:hypothetical protein
MYLDILHDVLKEQLESEKDKKLPISIELTPFIYETLQLELNDICKFRTEVPIESVNFFSIVMYGRSVKLVSGKELNSRFERKIVEKLTELMFKRK